MNDQLSKDELLKLYTFDDAYKWMEIISDKEVNHPAYKTFLKQKKRLERLCNIIDFKPTYHVVEYGCGNGIWADMIHDKIRTYIGLDFSKPFISIAKERQKTLNTDNVQFECEDIIEYSKLNNDKFDQAYALDFSEHVYDDDFLSIFNAIKSTIRNNGKLYIHTPNGDYFLERLKKIGLLKQTTGHIGIRNSKQYLKLLSQIGFKEINVKYISHYIKLLSLFHFLSYLPIIGKFFRARLLIECIK